MGCDAQAWGSEESKHGWVCVRVFAYQSATALSACFRAQGKGDSQRSPAAYSKMLSQSIIWLCCLLRDSTVHTACKFTPTLSQPDHGASPELLLWMVMKVQTSRKALSVAQGIGCPPCLISPCSHSLATTTHIALADSWMYIFPSPPSTSLSFASSNLEGIRATVWLLLKALGTLQGWPSACPSLTVHVFTCMYFNLEVTGQDQGQASIMFDALLTQQCSSWLFLAAVSSSSSLLFPVSSAPCSVIPGALPFFTFFPQANRLLDSPVSAILCVVEGHCLYPLFFLSGSFAILLVPHIQISTLGGLLIFPSVPELFWSQSLLWGFLLWFSV